jgi:hypothetical protein
MEIVEANAEIVHMDAEKISLLPTQAITKLVLKGNKTPTSFIPFQIDKQQEFTTLIFTSNQPLITIYLN